MTLFDDIDYLLTKTTNAELPIQLRLRALYDLDPLIYVVDE